MSECAWCGEGGATANHRMAQPVCAACEPKLVVCRSCGDVTDHDDTLTCWECEAERDEARAEDDGSPKFNRLLAGMGGRVMQ